MRLRACARGKGYPSLTLPFPQGYASHETLPTGQLRSSTAPSLGFAAVLWSQNGKVMRLVTVRQVTGKKPSRVWAKASALSKLAAGRPVSGAETSLPSRWDRRTGEKRQPERNSKCRSRFPC